MTALLTLAAFLLAFAGFTLLALAMERHRKQLAPSRQAWRPPTRRLLRLGGAGLLVLSVWACIHVWGAATGAVVWFGVLSAAALAVLGSVAVKSAMR